MAASDYNGKEKASLNNIKEMVANATSLEELRGNMGLGRELSTLQAANGGTGVTDLQGVADAIVDAMNQIKFSQYASDAMGTAYWMGLEGRGSGSIGLASSSVVGMNNKSNRITITKAGLYEVFARTTSSLGATATFSSSTINLHLPSSNTTLINVATFSHSRNNEGATQERLDFDGKLYLPANSYFTCEYEVTASSTSSTSTLAAFLSIVRCL